MAARSGSSRREEWHGRTVDLYLVHAPDPRTPWRTTIRALAKLVDTPHRTAPARRDARSVEAALSAVSAASLELDTPAVRPSNVAPRAQRSLVVETTARHGVPVSCLWIDTPLAQAQINMVERLLDRFGSLPSPEELRQRARREPGLHTPTSQMRAARELEFVVGSSSAHRTLATTPGARFVPVDL